MKRTESKVLLSSSNTDVAYLDGYGNLVAKKSGKIRLTDSVDDIKQTISIKVIRNPVSHTTNTVIVVYLVIDLLRKHI